MGGGYCFTRSPVRKGVTASMSTIIKIGAIRRVEDVDFVNEAMPDYADVVLCKRFYHGISMEEAKAIRERLDRRIPLVGVFVNDLFMDALVALRQGIIDIAQLQGTESEEYIRDLKLMSRKPVIKACQMDSMEVIPYMEQSEADLIQMDSVPDSHKTFDWNMVKDVKRPFILSGGLTPDNVADAIRMVHPWGVNFCGGVEDENGFKDREKLLRAVKIVRSL